jgi:hypothetical protein
LSTAPLRTLTLTLGLLLPAAALAGATVSTFKKETKMGANFYNAQAALDGKMDTCWMLPGESENVGEYILIDVPRIEVDKIGLVVGFAKDEGTFLDYARVKKVRVTALVTGEGGALTAVGTPAEASFEDKMTMQIIDIPDIKGESEFGGKVKIEVLEVYEGKDYPNLAVSEALVILGEFDAVPAITAISSEAEGTREALTDKNPKSMWSAPAEGAGFTLTAKGVMLSSLRLVPGPKTHARPKKVSVTTDNRTLEFELPDTAGPHTVMIPAVQGYSGTWNAVQVKILEVYPGTKFADKVALLDVKAMASSSDGL